MKATSQLPAGEYLGQNLLAVCHLVEAKIGHEINLINHRVSWLATSQSFLMLALITLLPGYTASSNVIIRVFLIAIPLMGFALCLQVYLAVHAAFTVLRDQLLRDRSELVTELNRLAEASFAALGPGRFTDIFGALPAKWIPVTFLFIWVFTLGAMLWLIWHP